jgi:ribonucleoside-diphosphate reductase alpha chain
VTAGLGPNAKVVLEHRYLLRDAAGAVVETPEQMFGRVAKAVAEGTRRHEGAAEAAAAEARYREAMVEGLFLPNSPTLMNAGTPVGQLAACFVLPIRDDLGSIFDAVRESALIHQTGGGTGFSFSSLRPRGDPVRETGGVASGPVSFMRVFDTATDVIKAGGRRRGANMAVLAASHPDILDFVRVKTEPGVLANFNLSVGVPDALMETVGSGGGWTLVNPRTGARAGDMDARALWRAIAEAAWHSGEPGLLFMDEVERHNVTPALGRMEATNPCGEQPLLPYEACTLGSVNLARLAGPAGFAWERLDELVRLGVRFLDDVIEVNRYPLPAVERMTRANRKIGLGVMGLAEALVLLGLPYASLEAVEFAGRLMERLQRVAREASVELGGRRGAFPNLERSVWPSRGVTCLRNATVTTIAPTGTISILAGTSSGIEPLFGLAFLRHVLDGTELPEVNPLLREALERAALPVEPILARVMETGSLRGVPGVPEDLRNRFATAYDVAPEWHVRMQAAVQAHTDNAVSKTVNLPRTATPEDVERVFRLAWQSGCKGVTVFRDGCRGEQVLHQGRVPGFAVRGSAASAHAEFAGECRLCST